MKNTSSVQAESHKEEPLHRIRLYQSSIWRERDKVRAVRMID